MLYLFDKPKLNILIDAAPFACELHVRFHVASRLLMFPSQPRETSRAALPNGSG